MELDLFTWMSISSIKSWGSWSSFKSGFAGSCCTVIALSSASGTSSQSCSSNSSMHSRSTSVSSGARFSRRAWRTWRQQYAVHSEYIHVAQLSQRDRAAGLVNYGQKWKTGTGRQFSPLYRCCNLCPFFYFALVRFAFLWVTEYQSFITVNCHNMNYGPGALIWFQPPNE